MEISSLSSSLLVGLFTILAALLAGSITYIIYIRSEGKRRLQLTTYPTENLTSELERSGLDIKITKSGQPVDKVKLRRLGISNIGTVGLTDLTFFVTTENSGDLLGVSYSDQPTLSSKNFVATEVVTNSRTIKVDHLNSGQRVDILAYSSGARAEIEFECKQMDFKILRRKWSDERKYIDYRKGFLVIFAGAITAVISALSSHWGLIK